MYVCFPLNSLQLSEQGLPGSPHPSLQERVKRRQETGSIRGKPALTAGITDCLWKHTKCFTWEKKIKYVKQKVMFYVTCCFFHCVRAELAVRKQHGNERGDTCRKGSKRLHKYSWRIAAKLISTENQGSQRAQGNVLRNKKKSSSHDSDTVLYLDLHLFLYPFP